MTMVCTPSSNWQGTEQDGSRWTTQQVSVLMKLGKDPLVVRTAKVRRTHLTTIELPCLIIAKGGARAKVILPSGFTQWMDIPRAR